MLLYSPLPTVKKLWRKTMKRKLGILTIMLVLAMLALAACGGGGETPDEPDNNGGNEQKIYYTISWVDENGNNITSTQVEEGTAPAYTYTVTDTAEWDYTCEGWCTAADGEPLSAIPAASANATYYAKVSAVKQKYTVSFNTLGGSAVDAQTVEYGSTAQLPDDPTYDGHRFVGWSTTEGGTETADLTALVTGNVTYFAVWNEVVDIKGLLSALLGGYQLDPMSYIPEQMLPTYSANLVDADDIISDYSSFVNTSAITYGFGEQWQMVLDNLQQSQTFFSVLSVVDALSASSVTAFNNYFDQNPANTAHHEFESGIYNVTINYTDGLLYYVVDFTATLPLFGEQTVQIALSLNAETGERVGRIQAGDANALTYRINEDSYEFAIKYLGVRRAMFTIEYDANGDVTGRIYEYLTVSGVGTSSAAEFYITDDYVSVVGNKADGIPLFTGYINELYSADNGRLLGYEVKETLSSIEYNTLFFRLDDINGINSIKYIPAEGETAAAFYVNGSNDAWTAKKVGGLSLKALSRRFDIEYRTQYVYSYDEGNESYVAYKVQVPMIFVQEENFDTFAADVKSANGINISVALSSSVLSKILLDYDVLIPIFIANKDLVTADLIVAYIGEKIEL